MLYFPQKPTIWPLGVTQSYISPNPNLCPFGCSCHEAHYQLAVGFACCELRSQHDKPNVLLYCVPFMNVTDNLIAMCPLCLVFILDDVACIICLLVPEMF